MDRERIKMFVMDCMFLFLYIVININMLFISEIKIIIEYRIMRMFLEVEEIFGFVILWLWIIGKNIELYIIFNKV